MFAHSFVLSGLLFIAASTVPTTTKSLLPEPGICGISVAERIAGGKITAVNAYPWTALIGKYTPELPRPIYFRCGGSLISNQFVLTAAHCFERPDEHNILVRLGEWDIESELDCYRNVCADKPIEYLVKDYLLHENYDEDWEFNDIALIRLPTPVNFTEFISPVCLPLTEDLQGHPNVGRVFTVIGWGDTENEAEESTLYGSRYKKETNIVVTDSERCYFGRPMLVSEFCVENNTNSLSCSGDSGGSVVAAENDGYWYQYGIVSQGTYCNEQEDQPTDQYVRLSYYITWIMDAMTQLDDTTMMNLRWKFLASSNNSY